MGKKRINVLIILIALLSLSFQPILVAGETYSDTLTSIAFSGTLTLTTTATRTQEVLTVSVRQERTCTVTIPFTVDVMSSLADVLFKEEGYDFVGISVENTLSFSGDWSLTVIGDDGSPASPSSGHVSGNIGAGVYAIVENDQVFFGFLFAGLPENMTILMTIPSEFKIIDRDYYPPQVFTQEFGV